MNLSEFRRAGHAPTLLGAFLYFTVSCMVWLIPGAWRTRSRRTSACRTRRRA